MIDNDRVQIRRVQGGQSLGSDEHYTEAYDAVLLRADGTGQQWMARRVAGNGQVGAWTEAYTERNDAVEAAQRWFPDVPRERYEIDE